MVVPLTERRKGDNPMNETAERVEKAGDINEAYRLVYIYGKENPKDIDGLIALNKLLISKTGDRANNANDRNIIYEAYRSIARCYKNKNLLGSGYPYDAKNYEMAADYYLKAFDKAPDSGTKLCSLDGAASMFWNLDQMQNWCRVRLQQAELLSDKDKTRIYMDIARETADGEAQRSYYRLALKYASFMAAAPNIRDGIVAVLKERIG